MLKYDAFIRTIDFPERSDSDYFHRIDTCRFDVATVDRKLHLIGSTISVTFSRKGQSTVGN
jgi:hypothetical protein